MTKGQGHPAVTVFSHPRLFLTRGATNPLYCTRPFFRARSKSRLFAPPVRYPQRIPPSAISHYKVKNNKKAGFLLLSGGQRCWDARYGLLQYRGWFTLLHSFLIKSISVEIVSAKLCILKVRVVDGFFFGELPNLVHTKILSRNIF